MCGEDNGYPYFCDLGTIILGVGFINPRLLGRGSPVGIRKDGVIRNNVGCLVVKFRTSGLNECSLFEQFSMGIVIEERNACNITYVEKVLSVGK